MSSYFSSRFKFKPEFISLVKSSSLKYIENKDEVFPGARPHLPPLQHKIDPFLSPPQSLRAFGAKERNPVHAYSIRFVMMFPHLAATHLSGIFEKRAEIPRLVFSEIQRKAEVTCS